MDSWVLHYWHSLKLWFKEFSLDRALSPTVVAVGSSANCNYHLYAVKLLVLLLLLFSPCNFTQQLYGLLLLTLNCQNQFCTLTPCFYISFHLTQPGGEIFSLKKKVRGLDPPSVLSWTPQKNYSVYVARLLEWHYLKCYLFFKAEISQSQSVTSMSTWWECVSFRERRNVKWDWSPFSIDLSQKHSCGGKGSHFVLSAERWCLE